MADEPFPDDPPPDGRPPVSGSYMVNVVVRGGDKAPTIEDIEAAIEKALTAEGLTVNAEATRTDR